MKQPERGAIILFITLAAMALSWEAQAGGWLGVTVERPKGVEIGEIVKDSPADLAKLQRGDLILQVDGADVRSVRHFSNMVGRNPAGTELVLKVLRNMQTLELKVTLDDGDKHPTLGAASRREQTEAADSEPATSGGRVSGGSWDRRQAGLSPHPGGNSVLPVVITRPTWLGITPVLGNGGIIVQDIASGSPADRFGLVKGDLIAAVNGQPITVPDDLLRLIQSLHPGEQIEVSLNRDGQAKNVTVELGVRPPDAH